MTRTHDLVRTDVVILGNGLSGRMAAHQLDPDTSVAIISPGNGASPHVIGFSVPLHPEDSVEKFIEDTLRSGSHQNDPALVRALCGDSQMMPEVLSRIGFELDRTDDGVVLRQALGTTYPRVVGERNSTGLSIMRKLNRSLLSRRGCVEYAPTRALRLLKRGSRVCGVLAYDLRLQKLLFIEAKAVIMACGGYCGIYPFSTNTRDMAGDVLALAHHAGAPLVDLEFVQFEPTAAVAPEPIRGLGVSTTMCPEGAVLRNVDDERFMQRFVARAELVNKDVMSRIVYEELQRGKGTPNGGVWMDATAVGAERLHSAYDLFVRRYAKFGIDITKDYMEVAPAAHTSLGGVLAEPDCSTVVQGLYACGESMGGVHGGNRLGGNAGLETLVFGRRAGLTVKGDLSSAPEPRVSDQECADLLESLRCGAEPYDQDSAESLLDRVREHVGESLNVIRNGESMRRAHQAAQEALAAIGRMRATDDSSVYRKTRACNDITSAVLVATAALARKQTLGCHTRSDSEAEPDRYRVLVTASENGPVVEKERLVRKRIGQVEDE